MANSLMFLATKKLWRQKDLSKKKISISFKQNCSHIYEYLKTKDNISSYICKLVEADMYKEQHSTDLEKTVEKIILKTLQNNRMFENMPFHNSDENKLSTEDIDLINQLF